MKNLLKVTFVFALLLSFACEKQTLELNAKQDVNNASIETKAKVDSINAVMETKAKVDSIANAR